MLPWHTSLTVGFEGECRREDKLRMVNTRSGSERKRSQLTVQDDGDSEYMIRHKSFMRVALGLTVSCARLD